MAKSCNESGKKGKGESERNNPISHEKLTAWQLRRLGWGIHQVSQMLEVSVTTITRWDAQVKKEFADLPTTRIATDAIQGLIPKAYRAYEAALSCSDMRVRKDAAKDILNNFKVLTDRFQIEKTDGDPNKSDDDLIAEAERIIAQATSASDRD